VAPAGRLDRWLGSGTGELMRRSLGLRFRHRSAGSEWPHTNSAGADDGDLLAAAGRLDHHG
jgi:hypothetical protein